MIISEVSISNLRATTFNKIKFSPGINILYGNNGAGKTTILESIYLLSYGKSFKSPQIETIIKNTDKEAGASLKTNTQNKLKITIFNNKKNITRDGVKVKKISEHFSFLPCIVSSPDEITIEGKQNTYKQKNINKGLCLINKEFLVDLKKYNTILKQRNRALKTGQDFKVWEEGLAICSEKIWKKREEYVLKINTKMQKINQEEKTKINTKIEIKTPKKTTFKEALNRIINSREKDVFTKKTTTGPHTDKIEYLINKKSIKTKASQGEKNLFFSVLKKTESDIIKKETGVHPIVLLDDIFSKLDTQNTQLVLKLFKNNPQTIITHTNKIESPTTQISIHG